MHDAQSGGTETTVGPELAEFDARLPDILAAIADAAPIDFAEYRKTTVLRRIARRAQLLKCTPEAYLDVLRTDGAERERLCRDLLLSFTHFFREPATFAVLQERVFPELTADSSAKAPVRFWIPGCSTGEEVYSLAIALYEYLSAHGLPISAQFFGTDIVEENIAFARGALYPFSIAEHVNEERLGRFFEREEGGYRVTKTIREMCVFATQDVVNDPPFPRIDCICCRNVLIYLSEEYQERVLPLFHFALKPQGFLILGSSETISRASHLFSTYDIKANIYRKIAPPTQQAYRIPPYQYGGYPTRSRSLIPPVSQVAEASGLHYAVVSSLADHFHLPGILVDASLTIRHFFGDTYPFVVPSSGEASLRLAKMAHETLLPDIYVCIEEAKKSGEAASKNSIVFSHDTGSWSIDLTVIPIRTGEAEADYFLIVFSRRTSVEPPEVAPDSELSALRAELIRTKNHLQAIIEEKEKVNFALWAANEEVQSTNEELQSVNEELEAAKEELESSNEELLSLNEELQKKNAELAATKSTLETAFGQSPSAILIVHPDGTVAMANKAAMALSRRPDALLPLHVADWDIRDEHGDPIADDACPLRRSLAGEILRAREYAVRDSAGNILPLLLNAAPIRNASGAVEGAVMIFHDISEQRRQKEALAHQERLLRHLFDNMQDGFALLRRRSKESYVVVQANRRFAELVPWCPTPVGPNALIEPDTVDMSPLLRERIDQVTTTGESLSFSDFDGDTGRHFWVRLYCPMPDHCACLYADITETITAQRRLQETESKFRHYVEYAPTGILVLDARGAVCEHNRAARDMLGCTAEELHGRQLVDFSSQPDKEALSTHLTCARIEGVATDEVRVQIGGAERNIALRTVKLAEDRLLTFANDVTEEKLMHAHVQEAEKMRAIGQLAGGIAHDFNNHLSAIAGFADLLLDEVHDIPRAQRYIQNIQLSVKRSSDLTAQLLAYSRKGKYLNVPLDIHPLIEGIVELLRHTLDRRIELRCRLMATRSAVRGDPSQLENALLQLAVNARDAMPNGGVLTISTDDAQPRQAPETVQTPFVHVAVQDTGVGIPAASLPHIFDPFFTTKEPGTGLGMGLAAAHGTIANHKGIIAVDSRVGTGTTFHIYLPTTSAPHGEDSASGATRPRRRILLVDDEPMVRESGRAILESLGHDVTTCADAGEAVAYYREHSREIDGVIVDMVMPGMNGKDTYLALRAINPDVCVVLTSGYSLRNQEEELRALGVRGLLSKPFRRADIAALLDSLCAAHSE